MTKLAKTKDRKNAKRMDEAYPDHPSKNNIATWKIPDDKAFLLDAEFSEKKLPQLLALCRIVYDVLAMMAKTQT